MAYAGNFFIYDGKPSKLFGLMIASFSGIETHYESGAGMELITDRASRSQRNVLLGAAPQKPLEFDLEVVATPDKMCFNLWESESIKRWLFGNLSYKKLRILHPDYENMYFNCVLNDPQNIEYVGRNGFKFTVVCDSGGGYENRQNKVYKGLVNGQRISFFNRSGDNDYLYPDVELKNLTDGDFSVVNLSDNNREFKFTGLIANETVIVKAYSGMITSSTGESRTKNFNKNYLRMIPGNNDLRFSGSGELTLSYEFFRRLGG